jgi:arylsulfatase
VSDIAPTILELVGSAAPEQVNGFEQLPMTGTSFAYTLAEPGARGRKQTQYFEMMGHRGIWSDGWKAVTRHVKGTPFEEDEWELYHVDEDFAEVRNLAKSRPDKLRELIELWWLEAGRNGVLPLDDRTSELFVEVSRPDSVHQSGIYRYQYPMSHIPADVVPPIWSESWSLTASIRPPLDCDLAGVIFSEGTVERGLSLYVVDGEIRFSYKAFEGRFELAGAIDETADFIVVNLRFDRGLGAAEVSLSVNGTEIATGTNEHLVTMMSWGGAEVGRSVPSTVSADYAPPFNFNGMLELVEIRTAGVEPTGHDAVAGQRFKSEMATQ